MRAHTHAHPQCWLARRCTPAHCVAHPPEPPPSLSRTHAHALGRSGSVLEVQRVLSEQCSRHLDKHKDRGTGAVRWKKAVGVSRGRGGSAHPAAPPPPCRLPRTPHLPPAPPPPHTHATLPSCAVQEVLRDQGDLFEQVGKADNGKIVWRLREGAEARV